MMKMREDGGSKELNIPHGKDETDLPRQNMTNQKWLQYTQALTDKGTVSGFAVYSRKSKQMWTSTPGFRVEPGELNVILSGFLDDSWLRLKGIWLEGLDFTLTRLSTNRVMMCGRNTMSGTGCVIYPCKTCVLIATHSGQHLSTCYAAIENLGDFLTRNGF